MHFSLSFRQCCNNPRKFGIIWMSIQRTDISSINADEQPFLPLTSFMAIIISLSKATELYCNNRILFFSSNQPSRLCDTHMKRLNPTSWQVVVASVLNYEFSWPRLSGTTHPLYVYNWIFFKSKSIQKHLYLLLVGRLSSGSQRAPEETPPKPPDKSMFPTGNFTASGRIGVVIYPDDLKMHGSKRRWMFNSFIQNCISFTRRPACPFRWYRQILKARVPLLMLMLRGITSRSEDNRIRSI